MGSDGFPIVAALFDAGTNPKAKIPLAVTNPWDSPLYDVIIIIFPRSGFSINGRTLPVGTLAAHEMFRRLNLEVPLDDYAVEITTKASPNGFFERLILTVQDGMVHQRYYVRRRGSDQRLMDVP
jgi:hypothetical protein